MNLTIEIPDFTSEKGFTYRWVDGFEIEIKLVDNIIKIIANKEGLISMANHFLNLAQDSVPTGHHLHLDQYNSLEDGSIGLIIQKG